MTTSQEQARGRCEQAGQSGQWAARLHDRGHSLGTRHLVGDHLSIAG